MKGIISIVILIQISFTFNYKCGADKIKLKPKPIDITPMLQKSSIKKENADTYTPIKIAYDFTTLKKPNSMSSTVFSNVKTLLQDTRVEFSKFLQVVHQDLDLSDLEETVKSMCELDTISNDIDYILYDNDVIIFPMFDTLDDGVLAAAAPCIIASKTYRPFGGVLYINKNLNFNMKNTEPYMKQILLHEITHVLVFHPYFFTSLNMNSTYNGKSYIKTEKVLAQAKKHFGCDSFPFPGVPLEDQGGDGSVGSHWESRHMLGDYMISTAFPDYAISDITLALFEDSGFYKVKYYSGGLFKFGKNKGCEFLTLDCIINEKAAFDEFCDVTDEPECSSSRALKSKCYLVTFSSDIDEEYQYFSNPKKGGYSPADYCPVPFESPSSRDYFPNHCQYGTPSNSFGETMGTNSLCFMSSLSSSSISPAPTCYGIECDSTNKQIKVTVGSYTVNCPTEGGSQTVSGLNGNIQCPSYDDICGSSDNIVCNDMFSCFTSFAEKDGYNYKTTYRDIEESDDDDFTILRTGEGNEIKINLVLLLTLCMFATLI